MVPAIVEELGVVAAVVVIAIAIAIASIFMMILIVMAMLTTVVMMKVASTIARLHRAGITGGARFIRAGAVTPRMQHLLWMLLLQG
jgi:hypothetical protein